jgi:pimeloyl-ACP methyl ester carboxylesterase
MTNSTTRTWRAPAAAALVALAVTALAACGHDGTSSHERPTTTTTTTSAVTDPATDIPDTPVGEQLRWTLDHLAADAQPLTVDEVNEHVSAEYLRDVLPANTIVSLFHDTIAERGGVQFERFAFDPRPESAVALVRAGDGEHAAVYLDVETQAPHRIETIALDAAPAEPLATAGPHTGMFQVDGRQLFLSCVGAGEPTVVLVGGLTSDWTDVQRPVSDTTRVCSYDKPNVLGSRSDHAPTPRDAAGMADELAALLDAAAVPGPYVMVGHSNGGMVAQLYAATHPDRIAGIVLVDSATEDQDLRAAELIRSQRPADQAEAMIAAMTAMPPRLIDPEQFDHPTSREQLRASRTSHPLPTVPMTVLVHGLRLDNLPPDLAQRYEPIWQDMQRQLAATVPGSAYQVVAGTGHDIHHDRPDTVAEAINDVVAAVHTHPSH